jgi:hypothetical protein
MNKKVDLSSSKRCIYQQTDSVPKFTWKTSPIILIDCQFSFNSLKHFKSLPKSNASRACNSKILHDYTTNTWLEPGMNYHITCTHYVHILLYNFLIRLWRSPERHYMQQWNRHTHTKIKPIYLIKAIIVCWH